MIIDLHAHLMDGENYTDQLLAAMDKAGIEKACLSAFGPHLGWSSGNAEVAKAANSHPDRFIGFVFARPGYDEPETIRRWHEAGMRGVKVTCPAEDYDHPAYDALWGMAEERQLPVLFHTGVVTLPAAKPADRISALRMHPLRLETISRAFPNLTLICAHLGIHWNEDAAELLRMRPNVYADISGEPGGYRVRLTPAQMRRYLWWPGAFSRLVFGTDVLPAKIEGNLRHDKELFRALGLPSEVQAGYFRENAEAILGLRKAKGKTVIEEKKPHALAAEGLKEACEALDEPFRGGAAIEPSPARRDEIRALLSMTPDEVISRAADRLAVYDSLDALHRALAGEMLREIAARNAAGLPTRLILPVGPIGQYAFLAAQANQQGVSMRDCRFFFMDEYCGPDGKAVKAGHPLSFKGVAEREFLRKLNPDLTPKAGNAIFPNEENIAALAEKIAAAGGIDTCYGGIGIHGHLAFNEPGENVAKAGPRRVRLNGYTVTINALRGEVGGNLAAFPHEAYTLGLRQILDARRIVLACRNGVSFDWANTVLRLALFGSPGDDYPVTHIRGRNYLILTDRETLASPKFLL